MTGDVVNLEMESVNTEAECRKEPTHHGLRPKLAGCEWPAGVICTVMEVYIACLDRPYRLP